MPDLILMPALSPTMTEGFLVKWHKNVGDTVRPGDLLMDVETDKAVMEVEATQKGILDAMVPLMAEKPIPVGYVVAVLREESEESGCGSHHLHWAAEKGSEHTPLSTPSQERALEDAPPPRCTPETSVLEKKNTCGIGKVHEQKAQAENKAASFSGASFGQLESLREAGPQWPEESVDPKGGAEHLLAQEDVGLQYALEDEIQQSASGEAPVSPLARKWAATYGVDCRYVRGSGPRGRVVGADIAAALLATGPESMRRSEQFVINALKETMQEAPQGWNASNSTLASHGPQDSRGPSEPLQEAPVLEESAPSAMRRVIAKRLLESKQTIPHFYASVECSVDALMAVRESLNCPEKRFSVNDFMIRACALSLAEHPCMRTLWVEKGPEKTPTLQRHQGVDLAIAVSVEGGLITPIIFNAAEKSLTQISKEMKGLAQRGRAGKLHSWEYQGGIFTLSNLGMFDVSFFQPIINPPHSGILGIGSPMERVVWRDGKAQPTFILTVTLAADHRVVDGDVGARFLSSFRTLIENPSRLLS